MEGQGGDREPNYTRLDSAATNFLSLCPLVFGSSSTSAPNSYPPSALQLPTPSPADLPPLPSRALPNITLLG